MDSVEIGLITCSPHDEVYSLYGHSAIHVRDYRNGFDIVYNYGIFNYNKPHFVLRFMFGQTDYELGIRAFRAFCYDYARWGSEVSEQILNLTPDEKQAVVSALEENYKPENRVYRYNIFYNNCSIRPRDLLEKYIDGKIVYQELKEDLRKSFREQLHELTSSHQWVTFGYDLLLGVKADIKTTQKEQQFLPRHLQHDFANARVERNGLSAPLVSKTVLYVPGQEQVIEAGFPLSPFACFIILLALSVLVFCLEQYKKTCYRWFDVALMLLTGLAGCIVFLMFFSEHPATSTNLQILILNPLALAFIPSVIRRKKTIWFNLSLAFAVLFYFGGLWQDYADGMEILALCLLLRYWRHCNDK